MVDDSLCHVPGERRVSVLILCRVSLMIVIVSKLLCTRELVLDGVERRATEKGMRVREGWCAAPKIS